MKRSPWATAKRTVRRGLTWRAKRDGDRPLDILDLISPLRYDVLVRADLFSWMRAEMTGRSDDEVVAGAFDQPYFVWFEQVAMARFRPWVLKDPALLRDQFTERVVTARRLAESIAERGFDPANPVTLRATSGTQTADSGARLTKTLHIGDGGHRTAILLSLGPTLAPEQYRVDPRPMPMIDNTRILASALDLSEASYAAFVGREFVPGTFASVEALRRQVDTDAPGRLGELDSVLAAHGRMPGAAPGSADPRSADHTSTKESPA